MLLLLLQGVAFQVAAGASNGPFGGTLTMPVIGLHAYKPTRLQAHTGYRKF